MMRLDDASRRRVALTLAITANLGLLGFSKSLFQKGVSNVERV